MSEKNKTITEWLDGGCSSWGVPSREITSLVEENKRMRELARRSLEMAKVMEGMTGCRGDDEWVWGLMDDLKSALGDTNA